MELHVHLQDVSHVSFVGACVVNNLGLILNTTAISSQFSLSPTCAHMRFSLLKRGYGLLTFSFIAGTAAGILP